MPKVEGNFNVLEKIFAFSSKSTNVIFQNRHKILFVR